MKEVSRWLLVGCAVAALVAFSFTPASASSKPKLVNGHVVSVTIRYKSGDLRREGPPCKQIQGCRADIALSKLPPATYGAWEARHLAWRINHLEVVGSEVYPCPLGFGNEYVIRFTLASGQVTTVFVAMSGCQFVTAGSNRAATRWATTPLENRLHSLLTRSGSKRAICPKGWFCARTKSGASLDLHWGAGGGFPMTLVGSGWPDLSRVSLRFSQDLGVTSSSHGYKAVTGLIVGSNAAGRFMVSSDESPCDLAAGITATTDGSGSANLKPVAMCMERSSPNPPIETFHVEAGRYDHAIYAQSHVFARYSLKLGPNSIHSQALKRSAAVTIARRLAGVGQSASVRTVQGDTGVGLAGIGTRVWEVWVSGVQVPHWGTGQEVVLVVMATQTSAPSHRGEILAHWFAP